MTKLKRGLTLFVSLLIALAGAGVAVTPAHASGPFYIYAGRTQAAATAGAYSTMDAEAPHIDAVNGYHSLAEVEIEKTNAGGKQVVEVGWTVDPALNGDSNPHLFVAWWKNGVFQCYNTACAGFVQLASPAPQAGQTLTTGVAASKRYGLQYSATTPSGGGWWFYASSPTTAFGYIPNTAWGTSAFSQSDKVQMFGESASSSLPTCNYVGSGTQGSTTAVPAAFFSSNSYISGPTVAMTTAVTDPSLSVGVASAATFYYGGKATGC